MKRDTGLVVWQGCLIISIMASAWVGFGAYCFEYGFEYWAAFFDKPIDLPFWVAILVAIPLGGPSVMLALFTLVMSFVI